VFIVFQIFVTSSERRTIGMAECVMNIQRHPRLTIFMSSEKAYATSYY